MFTGRMGWGAFPIHSAVAMGNLPAYIEYTRALRMTEPTQRAKLSDYLVRASQTERGRNLGIQPHWDWETFAESVPITRYENWQQDIERQKTGQSRVFFTSECERFEPTSGSTSKRKWIPYTRDLLNEFDQAASAWVVDLAIHAPKALKGRHYWSLSWLPNDLRKQKSSTDDSEIFPWWKRALMKKIFAVPSAVGRLKSLESSVFATLAYLAGAPDLSLLSVWSPTFALELLRNLSHNRSRLARVLERGQWDTSDLQRSGLIAPLCPHAAAVLKAWDGTENPDITRALWPDLALVSSWDSSTSSIWAAELRRLFPHSQFQAKGLWATEGVVTIPFQGHFPLAITSHFYEFRCLQSGNIFASWQLVTGQKVQPILTTGSGFLRYELDDELLVTGFVGNCPSFHFMGRRNSIDLVGEKIDGGSAAIVLEQMTKSSGLRCVSILVQVHGEQGRPQYVILAEGPEGNAKEIARLSDQIEAQLMEFHHYRLARELSQLGKASAIVCENALERYHAIRGGHAIAGSIKIEPLTLWDSARV